MTSPDLRPLGKLLKGVRIVLLGEASHFDGTDFLAKTRLIKFLHTELGFDVLAFRGGNLSDEAAWQAFRTGVDPQEAFSKGAFWMWGPVRAGRAPGPVHRSVVEN